MGQSYRIRTELGINKSINVQLDQQFEFLEILSLTLQQEDIYTKSCAQYGVVVGRVTANNGFGIPNARVSVFIPILPVDESNPIITSVYPYKSPNDRNEDGYRYNLLPYEKSYSTHAATGTLPSRLDSLTGSTAVEIYDKYYKYSVKTNESGDYMIMGVPQGNHTLVMDVDLSDIGEFSLTPQDLIRMGLASESQVAGNRFRTSTDLNSLPQIVNLTKDIQVSPLWGDPELCDIAINRVDFDLRDDANIDIQPTSVFMGSIYSTSDSYRIRPNAKPADDMGNLCSLVAGPGQILAIRQTIYQDDEGNPVLEQYQLEQSGNIIDGNGVWLTELPMNLDYFVTNEFGEKILSNDPTVGIPTKSKYRFKIKWSQSSNLSEQVRRPYYLVPNVKEYGWTNTNSVSDFSKQESSYYFGLAWSGYTNGFNLGTQKQDRLDEIINCEDTFYEFKYNKVYTVAGLIDEFKNGGRGNFIGIKEIDSQVCESTINKFPVNDGFKNFDLLYFIFAIILQIIQIIGIPLLTIFHFLAFLWNNFAVLILSFLIGLMVKAAVQQSLLVVAAIAGSAAFGATVAMIVPHGLLAILYTVSAIFLVINFIDIINYKFGRIKLPMMTYPECQACECDPESTTPGGGDIDNAPPTGILTQLSNGGLYVENLEETFYNPDLDNENIAQLSAVTISEAISGRFSRKNVSINKSTISQSYTFPEPIPGGRQHDGVSGTKLVAAGITLPPGERVNKYNTRKKYFDNINKISVRFNYPGNGGNLNISPNGTKHYDNTLTVLAVQALEPGTLLTFVDPLKTKDVNYLWTGTTQIGSKPIKGINGVIKNTPFKDVTYASINQVTSQMVSYRVPPVNSTCFLTLTFEVIEPGTVTYRNCVGVKSVKVIRDTELGPLTISDPNGVDITSLGGSAVIDTGDNDEKIIKGDACQRYEYPSDLEYYQVLTSITINTKVETVNGKTIYSLPNQGDPTKGFWNDLTADNAGFFLSNWPIPGFENYGYVGGNDLVQTGGFIITTSDIYGHYYPPNKVGYSFPTTILDGFNEQVVLILQRGVDPYSPKLPNSYGIGKILGHPTEEAVVITGMTRMNIPIQPLPSNSSISVQDHRKVNEIFSHSYFYTPGIPNSTTPGLVFSSYTTSNVGYYGALDSRYMNTTTPRLSITSVLKQVFFGNGNKTDTFDQQGPGLLGFTTIPRNTSTNYGVYSISVGGPIGMTGVAVKPPSQNVFGVQTTTFTNNVNSVSYGGTTLLNPSTRYRLDEDLSGASYMFRGPFFDFQAEWRTGFSDDRYGYKISDNQPTSVYFSPLLLPNFTGGTSPVNPGLTINNPPTQMVMRTDRLPSSDSFDVQRRQSDLTFLNGSVPLLQQNLSFAVYSPEGGLSFGAPSFTTGAQQTTADIGGQALELTVIDTMSTCENMVGLDQYEGNGKTFKVKPDAKASDSIESGCYVMMNRPLLDLTKDIGTFGEWGYRFRFFYGLCRGVLSQSFTNNWVNGSLYMFPIQADTKYNILGEPKSEYVKELVYFDNKTNTFYYRSSPYLLSTTNPRFIGSPNRYVNGDPLISPVNKRNLLFPTTIVDLGYKDDFYSEISFDPATKGYIMKSLNPTTYSDTSDLVNLFVITRITNSGFLGQILSGLNGSLDKLFSRPQLRIDGDLAQTMSINSEYGVIPFSPQFYNLNPTSPLSDPVVVLDGPTMGIFFSSTTFDLQNKDYLSPGIINFRPNVNSNAVATYEYGIKSQKVPFYQWELKGSVNTIFGTEKNDWATSDNDIFSQNYQSLSRRNADSTSNPSYFMGKAAYGLGDIYKRGYLFSVDNNGVYSTTVGNYDGSNNFLVGAPNHFYFGTIKGESALDKFKTKYSVDE
jgi:hypothetical protein